MEPACVPTCPSEALHFGDLNDPDSGVSQALREAAEVEGGLQQLRPEKETRPRMWFAGPAPVEVEDHLPREGESYNPEAYNIYNWAQEKAIESAAEAESRPPHGGDA